MKIDAATKLKIFLIAALSLVSLSLVLRTYYRPETGLYTETRVIMGTYVAITANEKGMDDDAVRKAVADAFAEVSRVDMLMSTYKPESQLSRVNANSGVKPVMVHPEVIETVSRALDVSELTGGAFDPTVGPLVHLWKVGSDKPHLPTHDEISAAQSLIGYKNVVVDKVHNTVFVTKKGMALDLGAIAKGYASDLAVAKLKERGISGGIVAIAGDIKTFGARPDGRPWQMGIQNPRGDGELLSFSIGDGAISTSGDYERYFIKDGVRYHHIMDPKTGYPAQGLISVSVLSKDSWRSDALSTGIFVMGPDAGYRLAKAHPELEVLMITTDNKTMATGRFVGMQVGK